MIKSHINSIIRWFPRHNAGHCLRLPCSRSPSGSPSGIISYHYVSSDIIVHQISCVFMYHLVPSFFKFVLLPFNISASPSSSSESSTSWPRVNYTKDWVGLVWSGKGFHLSMDAITRAQSKSCVFGHFWHGVERTKKETNEQTTDCSKCKPALYQ